MRTLKFIVDGQLIKQDPSCDFTGLVPGTEGYLRAEFSFSKEWIGSTKTVMFHSTMGKACPPQLLKDGKTCVIPSEVLRKRVFKISIIGKKANTTLTTNKVEVNQDGGMV